MDIGSFELNLESDDFRRSPIYTSIIRGNHHQLLAALQAGHDVHVRDPDFTSTYLHIVVINANSMYVQKYVPMIYQLSNASINVNASDYKGRTALELAIQGELQELITALIRVGADPTELPYKQIIKEMDSPFELEMIGTIEKYEPGLWSAVEQSHGSLVHILVNSWCRVNIKRDGCTLLRYARQTQKSEDILNTLYDYQLTLEFVHATLAGDEKRMFEFLMDSKSCDHTIMDISFQPKWSQPLTPRSLRDTALAMEHRHILHLLPEPDSEDCNVQAISLPESSERSEDLTPPTARRKKHRTSVTSSNSGSGNMGNLTDRSVRNRRSITDRSVENDGSVTHRSTGNQGGAMDRTSDNKGNITDRSLQYITSTLRRVRSELPARSRTKSAVPTSDTSVYMEQWYYPKYVEEFVNESPPNDIVSTNISNDYTKNLKRNGLNRAGEKLKNTTSKMCVIS